VERYNFKIIENKWQKHWDDKKVFRAKIDKSKKKILLLRNVSLSLGEYSYGSC
jgi:leucyl-tRNA synthetase